VPGQAAGGNQGFIAPMLATAAAGLPADADEFVAEVKWDGLRACVAVSGGRVRAWSRSGRDITAVYPELGALAAVAGRRTHVQGVAAQVHSLAAVLGADADLLQAAAWLHDIGYAPDLVVTGLHALDGARYLRDAQHRDAMLCRLVAHHSCAIVEAGERGLAEVLGLEFEPAPRELSSVLTYCDMTTSPDGELVPVEQRLAEIHDRYGPGHLVSRSIQRATPMILRAVEQVNDRVARNA
jgi:putative nucleotidyltransferase with HDIG domain